MDENHLLLFESRADVEVMVVLNFCLGYRLMTILIYQVKCLNEWQYVSFSLTYDKRSRKEFYFLFCNNQN